MVQDVSPEEVSKIVSETKLVLVDCWAPWCGPCLALAPIIEELEGRYSDNEDIKFIKLNTQNYGNFSAENKIVAIPCVLVYHNAAPASFEIPDPRQGKAEKTDRLIGLRPIEHYQKVIEQLL